MLLSPLSRFGYKFMDYFIGDKLLCIGWWWVWMGIFFDEEYRCGEGALACRFTWFGWLGEVTHPPILLFIIIFTPFNLIEIKIS